MTDQDSDIPISYDFHRGEINDECSIPLVGIYTLRIKNANVDGTFTVKLLIEQ